MLEPGRHIDSVHSDDVGETILGVINSVDRNKLRIVSGITDGYLNISNANEYERLEIVPYKMWRVIGFGMYWIAASTADEDPIIEFGNANDPDAYGKMSSVVTGGKLFHSEDCVTYDPLCLFAPTTLTETSGYLVITWTKGIKFGVWETTIKRLQVIEAAVAGMTSGVVKPYMIIEVDTGGKW